MKTKGKILFYNDQNGIGLIITKEKEKIKFNVEDWDDFEITPHVGLEVQIIKENEEEQKIISFDSSLNSNSDDDKNFTNATSKLKEYTSQKYIDKELSKTDREIEKIVKNSNNSFLQLDKSITLTKTIIESMQEYFTNIEEEIKKREGYKKVDGRLKYSLAKRFLWTTFNNLQDIDPHVITLRIKSISKDLLFMSNISDDFTKKLKYPTQTFHDVFLVYQTQYNIVKKLTEQSLEKLDMLREKEKRLELQKEKTEKDLKTTKDKKQRLILQEKYKKLNGSYADTVHVIGKLQEEYLFNSKRLQEFEIKYQKQFNQEFQTKAKKYHYFLTDILNAQAFLLDSLLWKEAHSSQPIRKYLKELSFDVEFNTKSYLKYFLNTLDEGKSTQQSKELFELYEHLKEMQQEYILLVFASTEDLLEYQSCIKTMIKDFSIKSFTDELAALKWSLKNSVKFIILEEQLNVSSATKFLDLYHKNILSKPQIILLSHSHNIHSKEYKITRFLQPGVTPQILASTILEVSNGC